MSTVLSLKMAAASWAGAAVDHSTAAAHSATRDIRSVRFMMPSSAPTLPPPRAGEVGWGWSVARKGDEINRAAYRVKRGSLGTGRGACGRTRQNQQFAASVDEFPARAEKFPAAQ